MQFARFRFATLHKQYLLFDGPVPGQHSTPATAANSFLAYCYHDQTKGLPCLLLGTTRFADSSLTIITETPANDPVLLTEDLLAEIHCTPVRRGVFDLSRFIWAEALADRIDLISQENDTSLLSRICGVCVHHRGRSGWRTCPAIPDGIPAELWNAETDPKIPCGKEIGFVQKEPRLFLEVFDATSGKVIYRYEAEGDPRCPEHVRESSDISISALAAFRDMMEDWHTHLAEPVKELLHCADSDGAFIKELAAINVVMTINKQTGRELYRIIDEFPEY
ncbi:MAG: hypothetical protein LBL85_03905 [Methanocalculaceae archaeon]|jgi:hypothetical protein|nr:hypothetical protein [Methanocalculaceae archaeon]